MKMNRLVIFPLTLFPGSLFAVMLCAVSAGVVPSAAEAQTLPSRTVELTCARSVSSQTSAQLKRQLFAEPFACVFEYKLVRTGRIVQFGEFIINVPKNKASITESQSIVAADVFDRVEIQNVYHFSALPIDRAWVSGRCSPVKNKFPKRVVTEVSSPYVGTYQQQASLEERFACK